MKKIFLIIFISLQTLCLSQSQNTFSELKASTSKNYNEIASLRSGLDILSNNFEINKENYKTLYDGLGNQIQMASNSIQIILFLIAILIAAIAFFIKKFIDKNLRDIEDSKQSIDKTKEEVGKILTDVADMRKNINETKDYIDNHNKEMLVKIKRDYTLGYLKRIEKIPEDIANLVEILLASDLEKEDFLILKNGLLKIKAKNSFDTSNRNYFVALLVQHFPKETIEDMALREDLIFGIDNNINEMFDVDVESFLHSLLLVIEEKSINFIENKILLAKFFKRLYTSKHKLNNHILSCAKEMIKNISLDKAQIEEILTDTSTDTGYIDWIKNKIII